MIPPQAIAILYSGLQEKADDVSQQAEIKYDHVLTVNK